MTPDLAQARYARMRWNTPLSERHAALLLDRLDVQPGESLLDLGCGWGELLLRAVATGSDPRGSQTTGVGVDSDDSVLDRGRDLAADRYLGARVSFVQASAAAWDTPADRVICIGASHAWGGTIQSLHALTGLVRDGGRLLFGDACWENPPTKAAEAVFGNQVLSLVDIIANTAAAGWRVLHLSTADQREWDDFESTWSAGRQEWLMSNPNDQNATAVRDELDARLVEYVGTYRGVLSFCYLVLGQ